MKVELLIIGITGFFIYDTYHDGKYIQKLKSWKKYYKMIAYGLVGLCIYIYFKRHPSDSHSLLKHANGIIKYMPIDKDASDMLTPFINDFNSITPQQKRMFSSGGQVTSGQKTKRSVSETKKKYVAANQNWKCGHCNDKLTAWFEVDHIQRLENGGSNHIDNLVALCRNCHGEKTALEKF